MQFYHKNQEIGPDNRAGFTSSGEWPNEKVESRVRPMEDFFPEPKTRRLQPISQDIGRKKKFPVKTPCQRPCTNCNCRGNANQLRIVNPGNQAEQEEIQRASTVQQGLDVQNPRLKYAPKNE